ncbi:hypothetical protein PENTCL1PPCAC_3511, partial [Pristionchus entomophagus]
SMIPSRTCVACDMSKPWRDMVTWTKDPELAKRWASALTPNDDEKHILELRLQAANDSPLYVCESHFDRDSAFKLTPSGFTLRPEAMPVDVRKLINNSSSQNAPSSSNNDMPPPSPMSGQPTSSRKRSSGKNMEEIEMPPPKMMAAPPNTFDITGTTSEMMGGGRGGGMEGGALADGGPATLAQVMMMNMGGGEGGAMVPDVTATVKIEEIEDDEQLTWVNSVIPLETPVERENRLEAHREAEAAAAA